MKWRGSEQTKCCAMIVSMRNIFMRRVIPWQRYSSDGGKCCTATPLRWVTGPTENISTLTRQLDVVRNDCRSASEGRNCYETDVSNLTTTRNSARQHFMHRSDLIQGRATTDVTTREAPLSPPFLFIVFTSSLPHNHGSI